MKKILFASDLDNTLIHSYKYKRENDICIELLNGIEQGFMSRKVYDELSGLSENIEFLPITTRSVGQFRRIKLPEGSFSRAVTTNGAILLENDSPDSNWQSKSLSLAGKNMPLMKMLYAELEGNEKLNVCRIVDEMYLYISCKDPADIGEFYERYRGLTELDVSPSGRKLYFLPRQFNKGTALKKYNRLFGKYDLVFCAGDSSIDLSMLNAADLAAVPKPLSDSVSTRAEIWNGEGDFAEFVMGVLNSLV